MAPQTTGFQLMDLLICEFVNSLVADASASLSAFCFPLTALRASTIPASTGAIIAMAQALVMCPASMMMILYDPSPKASAEMSASQGVHPRAIIAT